MFPTKRQHVGENAFTSSKPSALLPMRMSKMSSIISNGRNSCAGLDMR